MKTLRGLTVFLIWFVLLGITNIYGQKREETRIDEEYPTPITFPYDFLGNYSGNLSILDQTGVTENIPTDFKIYESEEEEDVFIYEFTYNTRKGGEKSRYKLHIIDEEKGYYAISDESGMEFMATLIGDVLYSTYSNKDRIMFTSLHFTNDQKMRFKVILSIKNKKKQGSELTLSNVVQVQRATLSKK